MKVFVIAETPEAARGLSGQARSLGGDEVILIAAGVQPELGVADLVAHIAVPEDAIVDDAYATICSYYDEQHPDVVLAESTRRARALANRLAAHAGTTVVANVIDLDENGATSLYYGGVGQRTVKPLGAVSVYTVSGSTSGAEQATGTDEVVELAFEPPVAPVKKIGSAEVPAAGVDLTKCEVVVGAGRGFSEEDQLDLARALCDKLDAGLGCTRPLSEGSEWLPKSLYIGVSGLMLTPKVYVGCGVSGQMQHMVGVNRAQKVFAINKDKNAPVFKQCDYGLVGDVAEVLPALVAAL